MANLPLIITDDVADDEDEGDFFLGLHNDTSLHQATSRGRVMRSDRTVESCELREAVNDAERIELEKLVASFRARVHGVTSLPELNGTINIEPLMSAILSDQASRDSSRFTYLLYHKSALLTAGIHVHDRARRIITHQ